MIIDIKSDAKKNIKYDKNYYSKLSDYIQNEIISDISLINNNLRELNLVEFNISFVNNLYKFYNNYINTSIDYKLKYSSLYPKSSLLSFNNISKDLSNNSNKQLSIQAISKKYKVSVGTAYNRVKKDFNYSYIKTFNRSINKTTSIFDDYAFEFYLKIKELLLKDYLFVFIDESRIQNNTNHKRRWIRKPEKNFTNNSNKDYSYNLIAACEFERLIFYKLYKDNCNRFIFKEFLQELTEHLIVSNNYKDYYHNKKIVLFVDNCSVHHSKLVTTYVLETNFLLLFSIPYSPELNIIEYMFNIIKMEVKKNYNHNE